MQNNDNPIANIPAAHLPAAVTVASQNGANVDSILKGLQDQINSLKGVQSQEVLPDVVLVNPSGRVVAVSGRNSAEYLAKAGFRKATPEEEANYKRAVLRQSQEFLKRVERKRLVDEKHFLDDLESDGELESTVSTEALLRTKVTDAQKTGALEPDQVAKLNTSIVNNPAPTDLSATHINATGSADNQTNTQTPVPSRKSVKTSK